ncbi:methyltransferase domain-containing protein [Aliarcobacter cryaerophilus]|uniref:methyltransferase domain-containing protein n=1 Tax=Aliarcobacter cryaerophilus TaxID=28198 RepID=UPI003BAF2D27
MKSFIKNKGKISFTYKDVGLQGEFMNYCRLEAWKLAINKYNIDKSEILDVGCSYGSWYENWIELGFRDLNGADVNEPVIEEARKKYNRVENVTNSSLYKEYKRKFKTVGSNGVLVHILKDNEVTNFCKDIFDILEDDGYFMVSILPAEYYSYGIEQYNNDNCVRTLEHNIKIIEKSGLKIVDKIGTFINPWYSKDFEWIANSDKMKSNPETFESFAKLSDLLRSETIVPFSEILLVCQKGK